MKNHYEIRGNVTAIFLSRKDGSTMETLIDTTDLPRAMELPGTWHASWYRNTQSFYTYANIKKENKWKTIGLHVWLMQPSNVYLVDHIISGQTLDNRRANLRIASQSENSTNRKGATRKSKSGIRGVSWHKATGKWYARVRMHGEVLYEKYFSDLKEAESAVKAARAKYMSFSEEARFSMLGG